MKHADVHNALADWLDASWNGTLSERDSHRLADHLAQCPRCRAVAEDPEELDRRLANLEQDERWDEDWETERAEAFRRALHAEAGAAQTPGRAGAMRYAIRAALFLTVAALWLYRELGIGFFSDQTGPGQVVSVLAQLFGSTPDYAEALAYATKAELDPALAAVYSLTTMLTSLLLWTLALVAAGLTACDLFAARLRRPRWG